MTTCAILPFPASRRSGRIRRVAQVLLRSSGKSATAYWKRTVRTMNDQMVRSGLPTEEIERELRSFWEAVQAEMRRSTDDGGRGHGGAA